jgi:hypothetical protein
MTRLLEIIALILLVGTIAFFVFSIYGFANLITFFFVYLFGFC